MMCKYNNSTAEVSASWVMPAGYDGVLRARTAKLEGMVTGGIHLYRLLVQLQYRCIDMPAVLPVGCNLQTG